MGESGKKNSPVDVWISQKNNVLTQTNGERVLEIQTYWGMRIRDHVLTQKIPGN